MATLSAQHASKEHQVVIHTLFVEPFNPIIGAQYLVLGETERVQGEQRAFYLFCLLVLNCFSELINENVLFFQLIRQTNKIHM